MSRIAMRRPLIGLTTSEVRRPDPGELIPHADVGTDEFVLGVGYLRAVTDAGGAPLVMSPLEPAAAPAMLDGLDGVCLPGGPDVDPSFYGAARHPKLGPTFPELDRFELAVVREAERRGMPLLAICRGIQMLNVAHGGDLLQHLPDNADGSVRHRRDDPADPAAWHEVRVEPGSRLAGALGSERLEVNSFHHQAPNRIGDGLRPVAWTPDGVVEGLELPEAAFELAVQWHAEAITDRPEQTALFRAFVEAARGYADRTKSTASAADSTQRSESDGGSVTTASGIR
jgi:putative glutamine amidotransferase